MAAMEDEAVAEFIAILEEHRDTCTMNGKYVEAELTTKRLDELRLHDENRKREITKSRHIADRLGVEEAHMQEFEQFNYLWDIKMQEYDEKTRELVRAMEERQARELLEWHEEAARKALLRPKFSKQLLNVRRVQKSLAKQRKYEEAQSIKEQADAIEAKELLEMKRKWSTSMKGRQRTFLMQQEAEKRALQQRVLTGRSEQKRVRQRELDRILLRYQNIKKELERQQRIEMNNAEKLFASRRARKGGGGGAALGSAMRSGLASTGGRSGGRSGGGGGGGGGGGSRRNGGNRRQQQPSNRY